MVPYDAADRCPFAPEERYVYRIAIPTIHRAPEERNVLYINSQFIQSDPCNPLIRLICDSDRLTPTHPPTP